MRGRVPFLLRLARWILVWSAQAGLACLACLVWHGGSHSSGMGQTTQTPRTDNRHSFLYLLYSVPTRALISGFLV